MSIIVPKSLLEKAKRAAAKQLVSKETAGNTLTITTSITEREDVMDTAILLRLYRLADARLDSLITEHTVGIVSIRSADTAIDTYTEEYLLDLPISYEGIARLCRSLLEAIKKYEMDPPEHWLKYGNEQDFPYEYELERAQIGM